MGKILLLEDEESVNRGISFTLERDGYNIFSCSTIKEAEKVFKKEQPDVLICDINLPDGNGLEFIKKVRNIGYTHIICLTALDEETDYVMGYSAGADDYIAKPFSLSILSMKIRAYFQRYKENAKEELHSGNIHVNLQEMKVWKDDKEIFLTKNEWKMICLFLQHPKQILSKKQILEQLFDVDGNYVDENTLAVNIKRLREKIEPDLTNPEYIQNIRGIGYIWAKDCIKI